MKVTAESSTVITPISQSPSSVVPQQCPAHAQYPSVDIVTVTYNSMRHLPTFIGSVRGLDYPNQRLRLIIVDNASRDGTVRKDPEVRRTFAVSSWN